MPARVHPAVADHIITSYALGQPASAIAKDVGVTAQAIRDLLRRRGQPLRKRTSQLGVRLKAFAPPHSPEALYWAGFAMIEGSISRDHRLLTLEVYSDHAEHLQKFNEFLGTPEAKVTRALRNREGRAYEAFIKTVESPEICKDLALLGVARKGADRPIPPEAKVSPAFWRGVMDAGGQVEMIGPMPCVSFTGYPWACRALASFLNDLRPEISKATPRGMTHTLVLRDDAAVQAALRLYLGAPVALEANARVAALISQ